MSDFLDHLFNAIGHAGRAIRQGEARAAERRAERAEVRRSRKVKVPEASRERQAFDAAPPAPPADDSCCTAKRK